jgi:hypothetical protein
MAGFIGAYGRKPWVISVRFIAPTRWIFGGLGNRVQKRETYALKDFVSLVNQFMEQLGIVARAAGGAQHGRYGQPDDRHSVTQNASKSGCDRFADRHFPMLEEPRVFAEKLKAFLDQDNASVARKTSPRAAPQKTSPSVTL